MLSSVGTYFRSSTKINLKLKRNYGFVSGVKLLNLYHFMFVV